MDDLMSKLQEVLNNKESMNQVMQLAGMLGANKEGDTPDLSSIFGGNNNDNSNNGNENHSTDKSQNSDDNEPSFDFSKLLMLQELFSKKEKDKNTELLYALKPLLKNDNQVKIDKVAKIFKLLALWPLLKESGLLGGDLLDIL